tara:strand:- start:917 stop:1291 length:375 start_codon:yes stop_codon:yes gene_type:complete
MKLTRYVLKKCLRRVNNYINEQKKLGIKSDIMSCSKLKIRKSKIDINYRTLTDIIFIYDSINKHWAETDGYKIWLNTYKEYNDDTLYYTLLHENLHGIIYRNGENLSEYLEHEIMKLLNIKLIE